MKYTDDFGREWTTQRICGDTERTSQGTHGTWTIYDPAPGVESYRIRFLPYNKDNWHNTELPSWEFLPDGSAIYRGSTEDLWNSEHSVFHMEWKLEHATKTA